MAFIRSKKHMNPLLRLGVHISERITGKRMDAARLLAWYPKAALSSGIMESLVAHEEAGVSRRLLKLIRMQVSFIASCPFCIDMNSEGFDREGITDEEIKALQGETTIGAVESFSESEKTALAYAAALTQTPIRLNKPLIRKMKMLFDERQMVIIATTIGQVNYWTRTIQGLGIQPAGFSRECKILNIERYKTFS